MDLKIKTELIYELEKDKQIFNAADFKRKVMAKYDIPLELAADLFVRVCNYQIEKYGTTLSKRLYIRRKVRGEDGVWTFKEV